MENKSSKYQSNDYSDSDKLEYNAGFLLRRAFKNARKHMLTHIADFDLTPMQTAALHALVENGPTSQNKLGRYIGMEPGNVHGLVERLTRKGFITSRRDLEDARHYVLELTESGLEIANQVIPLRFVASEAILAPLDSEERKIFLQLLAKLS